MQTKFIIVVYGSMLLDGHEESPKLHDWPETTFVLLSSLSSYSFLETGTWGTSALITPSTPRVSPRSCFASAAAPQQWLVPELPAVQHEPPTTQAQHQLLSKTRISSLRGCSARLH